jgi:hypothetical protein
MTTPTPDAQVPSPQAPGMPSPEAQDQYFALIDRLLKCPAGEEPEVLNQHLDLLNVDFVNILMQVATSLAHNDQQDASKFLIHVARNLAKELGLYPQV